MADTIVWAKSNAVCQDSNSSQPRRNTIHRSWLQIASHYTRNQQGPKLIELLTRWAVYSTINWVVYSWAMTSTRVGSALPWQRRPSHTSKRSQLLYPQQKRSMLWRTKRLLLLKSCTNGGPMMNLIVTPKFHWSGFVATASRWYVSRHEQLATSALSHSAVAKRAAVTSANCCVAKRE